MNLSENFHHLLLEVSEPFAVLLDRLSRKPFTDRPSGIAIVTSIEGRVVGVVTDADLRKFLLNHGRAPVSIDEVVNRDFIWIPSQVAPELVAAEIASRVSARGWSTSYPVRYVPVLDLDYRLVGLIDSFDYGLELRQHRDQIVVVGLGYVGLTVALAFAEAGFEVIGIDSDLKKIELLRDGESTLFEEGIEEALLSYGGRNLSFQEQLSTIVRTSGRSITYVLCLPTPLDSNKETLDLSSFEEFARYLIPHMQQGDCLVVRSTMPLGSSRSILERIQDEREWTAGSDFYFVQAPERTVEGNALKEIRELPQILAGASLNCAERGHLLFQGICNVIITVASLEMAELIKIAGNSFRDYTFAFANFLAEISRLYNLDVNEVIEKSNLGYPRSTIPKPSPGVGGPCLTKDPYLLADKSSANYSVKSPVTVARKYNEQVPTQVTQFVLDSMTRKQTAICLGMAFKGVPATNDLRSSSSNEIAKIFSNEFSTVFQWDAVIHHSQLDRGLDDRGLTSMTDVDLLAILNNHPENSTAAKKVLKSILGERITIFDPWRMLDLGTLFVDSKLVEISYLTLSIHKVLRR